MKQFILLLLICFFGMGCSLLPKFMQPRPPDTHYNWNEKIVTTPKCVMIEGKCYPVVYETIKELSVGMVSEEKKLTFLQKIGNWISGLSFIAFVVSVGGLLLGTGGPILWILGRYRTVSNALKEVVLGIKESKMVDKNPELHDALSSATSLTTKKIVDDLRRTV